MFCMHMPWLTVPWCYCWHLCKFRNRNLQKIPKRQKKNNIRRSITLFPFEWCKCLFRVSNHQSQPLSRDLFYDKRMHHHFSHPIDRRSSWPALDVNYRARSPHRMLEAIPYSSAKNMVSVKYDTHCRQEESFFLFKLISVVCCVCWSLCAFVIKKTTKQNIYALMAYNITRLIG